MKLALLLAVALWAPSIAAQCNNNIAGYVTRANTNWVRSSKTQESQTAPANAQQICSLDANCIAWNNFGYYILASGGTAPTTAATGLSFTSYSGLCTYVKASALPSCPDREGYVTKTDTNWVGTSQTQESQTSPANAQQICNLDSNCLGFNSFGYYILAKGGANPAAAASGISFTPYDKLCTYIKASVSSQSKPSKPADTGANSANTNRMLAFRNKASNQCFAANDAQRLLAGAIRLGLVPCSSADNQGFRLVSSNQGYTIVDNKGRCLTAYNGLLIDTVAVMPCNKGVDQLWSITTSSAGGPSTIKNKQNGQCITRFGNLLSLGGCSASNPNAAFTLGPK